MSTFDANGSLHDTKTGQYAPQYRAESTLSLNGTLTPTPAKASLKDLKFKNPKVITADLGNEYGLLLTYTNSSRRKETYAYDTRTECATKADGTIYNRFMTRELLKAIRDAQESKVGIDRMQRIMKDSIEIPAGRWDPHIPAGATILAPTVHGTDRDGQPVATTRYSRDGYRNIVTAGKHGAVEIWERGEGASKTGLLVVHSAEPRTDYEAERGGYKCEHIAAGKCYIDSSTGGYEDLKFIFDAPTATLGKDYNDQFTDDPNWA